MVRPTSHGIARGAKRNPPRIAAMSVKVATASASHWDSPLRTVVPIANGAAGSPRRI
jgi:hypothetical protein